mgnify:FL=1|jgi:hypothetical protein
MEHSGGCLCGIVRSKAYFVGEITTTNHEETFFSHNPKVPENERLKGP